MGLTAVLRVAIALVLAVSAAGKAVDPWVLRARLADALGRRWAGPGSVGVIGTELVVGAAVLWAPGPATAAAAAALFLAFAWVLVGQLASGDAGDCGCLGILGDAPASWGLVARNVVLGGAGAWAAWARAAARLALPDIVVGVVLAGCTLLVSFVAVWVDFYRVPVRGPGSALVRSIPVRLADRLGR